jgi:hypothetical protein
MPVPRRASERGAVFVFEICGFCKLRSPDLNGGGLLRVPLQPAAQGKSIAHHSPRSGRKIVAHSVSCGMRPFQAHLSPGGAKEIINSGITFEVAVRGGHVKSLESDGRFFRPSGARGALHDSSPIACAMGYDLSPASRAAQNRRGPPAVARPSSSRRRKLYLSARRVLNLS